MLIGTDARRAPLGNKTTNAKARTGQAAGGVKNMVKEIEKTQLKPTTTRKLKQKTPVLLDVKNDETGPLEDDVPEPEFAPPRPADLPFESDLIPKGGLKMEGLKHENLYRGFYKEFCNPVDDDGVSQQTKRFNKEMEAMMERAVHENAKELDALDWNEADKEPSPTKASQAPGKRQMSEAKIARKIRNRPANAQPSGSLSRKAAVALAQPARSSRPALGVKPALRAGEATTRRPLASIMSRRQPTIRGTLTKSTLGSPSNVSASAGAFASRNTLGYSRGKSASSAIRPLAPTHTPGRAAKSPALQDDTDLTITPLRARQAGVGMQAPRSQTPQFMSIFDAEDDEDLPPMTMPDWGDEEEDFELKLDI